LINIAAKLFFRASAQHLDLLAALLRSDRPSATDVLVRHGIVIGVFYSSQYIVVAADGREVDGANRPVNDRKCKIDRLHDAHFFFSFGRTRFTDLARHVLADAHAGARQVLSVKP
jgi:hypothetical protein